MPRQNIKIPTMSRLSPQMRAALFRQLQGDFELLQGEYQFFLDQAREVLPARCSEERFPFVIRRLWFAFSCAPPEGWQKILAQRYEKFVQEFEWASEETQFAFPLPLVERTLSLWQRHLPTLLTAKHAHRLISDVRRLATLPGGLQ